MPYQYASIRDYVIFEPPPTLQPVSLSFSKEDNSTASSFPKIIIICTVHYEPKAISCAFLPMGLIVTSMTYVIIISVHLKLTIVNVKIKYTISWSAFLALRMVVGIRCNRKAWKMLHLTGHHTTILTIPCRNVVVVDNDVGLGHFN